MAFEIKGLLKDVLGLAPMRGVKAVWDGTFLPIFLLRFGSNLQNMYGFPWPPKWFERSPLSIMLKFSTEGRGWWKICAMFKYGRCAQFGVFFGSLPKGFCMSLQCTMNCNCLLGISQWYTMSFLLAGGGPCPFGCIRSDFEGVLLPLKQNLYCCILKDFLKSLTQTLENKGLR